MQWHVKGLDRDTGEERELYVLAEDQAHAAAFASAQGVVSSSITLHIEDEPPPPPVPTLDYIAANVTPKPHRMNYAAKLLDTQINGTDRRLRLADTALSIVGVVFIALSIVGTLFLISRLINFGIADEYAVGYTLVLGLAGLGAGALLLGIGAALRMIGRIGVAVNEINQRHRRE